MLDAQGQVILPKETKDQLDAIVKELNELRAIRDEYLILMDVIMAVADEDPDGTQMSFSIAIKDVESGMTWTDVVKKAIQLKLANKKITVG